DFILVTHAHIDHTGLLPRLVANGFKGPVYATAPTRDLMEILLLDSAHIQEMEAEWKSRKRQRHGDRMVEALYHQADAQAAIPLIKTVNYGESFEPAPGLRVTYKDAGHILGAAFIELTYSNGSESTKMVFSGDIGRPEQLIVNDPDPANTPDYLFMESTYGDRNHKDEQNSLDELAEAVGYSYRHGEKVVIPAFAVERSQQIIYSLFLLSKQGRLPKDMPVYLDSPLAIRATEIFKRHPEFYDARMTEFIKNGEHPLSMRNLKFTLSTDESRAINETPGPAVIISASGMANAGRVKHHLRHNLWRKGASVVFVGYQAEGTPGRKIVNGAKKITIFNEEIAVAARVFTIGGFSAHAGQRELLDWLTAFHDQDMKVILVHGEPRSQKVLARLIRERLSLEVHAPDYLEELTLEPGRRMVPVLDEERATPRVDWNFLMKDSEHLFAELKTRLGDVGAKPWLDQTEVRDRLLEVNRRMLELISEM
ncbi:MAG: MBL fold metallo-hydrolase, partial [Desulfovibrionaceae bacterium]|nr:MBL fold metallo-hydrolase [Desulfovibrionaceae bacterium]